jgi:hypothetical protein
MLEANTTWEPIEEFRALFPAFQLKDELFTECGRDVMIRNVYRRRRANCG